MKQFKQLSCPEKWWVIWHPFVAKKAYEITNHTKLKTDSIKQKSILNGSGNGDQVDAFRHAYWMANLVQELGWKRAKSLGKAHEKGNYRDFKKRKNEDGELPDRMSSKMDLFNNIMGLAIGMTNDKVYLEESVINAVKNGNCKIIKKDVKGNYLDCEGSIIEASDLKGKWENSKCLVPSNETPQ